MGLGWYPFVTNLVLMVFFLVHYHLLLYSRSWQQQQQHQQQQQQQQQQQPSEQVRRVPVANSNHQFVALEHSHRVRGAESQT